MNCTRQLQGHRRRHDEFAARSAFDRRDDLFGLHVLQQVAAHPGVERDFYNERAWAGALTLIVLVMLLNLLGRFIAKRFAPKTGR